MARITDFFQSPDGFPAAGWRRALHAALLLAMALGAGQGCGTAEYEARLERTRVELDQKQAELKRRQVFDDALGLTAEFPGTPIRLRLPRKDLDHQLKPEDLVFDKKVDPRRLRIPFLDLGSSLITCEAFIEDANHGQIPYYLYLAVADAAKNDALRSQAGRGFTQEGDQKVPSQGPDRMDSSGTLYQNLKRAFPNAGNWEDVAFATPEGGQVAWQKIRVTGDQEFYYLDYNKQETFPKLPGLLELYARSEGNYLVIIAWRMPTAIEANSRLAELAPLVAGSMQGGN